MTVYIKFRDDYK